MGSPSDDNPVYMKKMQYRTRRVAAGLHGAATIMALLALGGILAFGGVAFAQTDSLSQPDSLVQAESPTPFTQTDSSIAKPPQSNPANPTLQSPQPISIGATPERGQQRSVRAIWIVRDALTSRAGIRKIVNDAAEGGITDLLVQVRGRGDAYFPSRQAPVAPLLQAAWRNEGDFDPLALIIEQAHARGLRVHAWLNVYLVWSNGTPPPGHVLTQHPEWVAVNASGIGMDAFSLRKMLASGTEGVFLEPGNCDVVRHFLGIVGEILTRYDVDGIHLDYVRYPRMNVGYSDAMRAGFQRKTGIDPIDLDARRERYEREMGPEQVAELDRKWHQFKADQVTALVRNVRAMMTSRRPDAVLTAAVRPDPDEALYVFGQDWVRWVNQGWVDAVAPMMYSASTGTVTRQVIEAARRVPPDRIWAGIAIYNQSVGDAVAKIRDVRARGVDGLAIYSYNSLTGGVKDLRRLTEVGWR
jgi:uncharacterized lipoprotein YddW (UPF0748 family)